MRVQDDVTIDLRDVTVTYPTHRATPAYSAIEAIDLRVNRGQILGIVGETGSGKSTLAAVLSGRAFTYNKLLGRPRMTSGSAHVLGMSLATLTRREKAVLSRRVGFLPQDASNFLHPSATAEELLSEPLARRVRVANRREIGTRVYSILDAVCLPLGVADKFPYELSAGQRQRLALARALVTQPDVLVADEPSAGVDVSVRGAIVGLIQELQRERNFCTVMISSDLDEIRRISSRVAVLYHGYLVASGPTESVLSTSEHPYVDGLRRSQELLGAPVRLAAVNPVLAQKKVA